MHNIGMKTSPEKKVIETNLLDKGLMDLYMKFHINRSTGAGDISDLAIPK